MSEGPTSSRGSSGSPSIHGILVDGWDPTNPKVRQHESGPDFQSGRKSLIMTWASAPGGRFSRGSEQGQKPSQTLPDFVRPAGFGEPSRYNWESLSEPIKIRSAR